MNATFFILAILPSVQAVSSGEVGLCDASASIGCKTGWRLLNGNEDRIFGCLDATTPAMPWATAPVRSTAYSIESDQTTYLPGEYVTISVKVLEYGRKYRGLMLHGVNSAKESVGSWAKETPESSYWHPPTCGPTHILHNSADVKNYIESFRFLGPSKGTGPITFLAMIKEGPANQGAFFYPNSDLILQEGTPSESKDDWRWYLGGPGESCDEVCGALGQNCVPPEVNPDAAKHWEKAGSTEGLKSTTGNMFPCDVPRMSCSPGAPAATENATETVPYCFYYDDACPATVSSRCSSKGLSRETRFCLCNGSRRRRLYGSTAASHQVHLSTILIACVTSLSMFRGHTLLWVLLIVLCISTPYVNAHNWQWTRGRGGGRSFASAVCPHRRATDTYAQIGVNEDGSFQKFVMSHSLGHGGPAVYIVVPGDKEHHLRRLRESLVAAKEYIGPLREAAGAKNLAQDMDRKRYHGVQQTNTGMNEKDKYNKFNMFTRSVDPASEEFQSHIPNSWRPKKVVTARDVIAEYSSEKYPWIDSVGKYDITKHHPHDGSLVKITVSGRHSPGHYVVLFHWRGYVGCADFDFFDDRKVEHIYGKRNNDAPPVWNRIDHCQFATFRQVLAPALPVGESIEGCKLQMDVFAKAARDKALRIGINAIPLDGFAEHKKTEVYSALAIQPNIPTNGPTVDGSSLFLFDPKEYTVRRSDTLDKLLGSNDIPLHTRGMKNGKDCKWVLFTQTSTMRDAILRCSLHSCHALSVKRDANTPLKSLNTGEHEFHGCKNNGWATKNSTGWTHLPKPDLATALKEESKNDVQILRFSWQPDSPEPLCEEVEKAPKWSGIDGTWNYVKKTGPEGVSSFYQAREFPLPNIVTDPAGNFGFGSTTVTWPEGIIRAQCYMCGLEKCRHWAWKSVEDGGICSNSNKWEVVDEPFPDGLAGHKNGGSPVVKCEAGNGGNYGKTARAFALTSEIEYRWNALYDSGQPDKPGAICGKGGSCCGRKKSKAPCQTNENDASLTTCNAIDGCAHYATEDHSIFSTEESCKKAFNCPTGNASVKPSQYTLEEGWYRDTGKMYSRQGDFSYGWKNCDVSKDMWASAAVFYKPSDVPSRTAVYRLDEPCPNGKNKVWETDVPNPGMYKVTLGYSVEDSGFPGRTQGCIIEGIRMTSNSHYKGKNPHVKFIHIPADADGIARLTIEAESEHCQYLSYLTIEKVKDSIPKTLAPVWFPASSDIWWEQELSTKAPSGESVGIVSVTAPGVSATPSLNSWTCQSRWLFDGNSCNDKGEDKEENREAGQFTNADQGFIVELANRSCGESGTCDAADVIHTCGRVTTPVTCQEDIYRSPYQTDTWRWGNHMNANQKPFYLCPLYVDCGGKTGKYLRVRLPGSNRILDAEIKVHRTKPKLPPREARKGYTPAACYGLLSNEPTTEWPAFIVSKDPDDPIFYSSCWIRESATSFIPAPKRLAPPKWKYGRSCVSCLSYAENAEISNAITSEGEPALPYHYPRWIMTDKCVDCSAAIEKDQGMESISVNFGNIALGPTGIKGQLRVIESTKFGQDVDVELDNEKKKELLCTAVSLQMPNKALLVADSFKCTLDSENEGGVVIKFSANYISSDAAAVVVSSFSTLEYKARFEFLVANAIQKSLSEQGLKDSSVVSELISRGGLNYEGSAACLSEYYMSSEGVCVRSKNDATTNDPANDATNGSSDGSSGAVIAIIVLLVILVIAAGVYAYWRFILRSKKGEAGFKSIAERVFAYWRSILARVYALRSKKGETGVKSDDKTSGSETVEHNRTEQLHDSNSIVSSKSITFETKPVVEWHVIIGEEQKGPLSIEEMKDMWARSEMTGSCLVWAEHLEDWIPISDEPVLFKKMKKVVKKKNPPPVPPRSKKPKKR